jgi:hypothetical protein
MRAARQPSLVISSMAGATKALKQLKAKEAALIKTMDGGRATLAIRNEAEGSESRIAPDLHSLFREFIDPQTAQTQEQAL